MGIGAGRHEEDLWISVLGNSVKRVLKGMVDGGVKFRQSEGDVQVAQK